MWYCTNSIESNRHTEGTEWKLCSMIWTRIHSLCSPQISHHLKVLAKGIATKCKQLSCTQNKKLKILSLISRNSILYFFEILQKRTKNFYWFLKTKKMKFINEIYFYDNWAFHLVSGRSVSFQNINKIYTRKTYIDLPYRHTYIFCCVLYKQ